MEIELFEQVFLFRINGMLRMIDINLRFIELKNLPLSGCLVGKLFQFKHNLRRKYFKSFYGSSSRI